jgi:hypothetical protein
MPKKLCGTTGCPNLATAKGLCDLHRREKERKRSAERRGGYKVGPLTEVTDARDADPGYRYPRRDHEAHG